MKIYYEINYNQIAAYADSNIHKENSEDFKKINIKDILERSLSQHEKYKEIVRIRKVKDSLETFLYDFQKCSNIKMAYLDGRGKSLRNCETDAKNEKITYNNIVFLGINKSEWPGYCAAIFTNLVVSWNSKYDFFEFKFEINRIEFNKYDQLYEDDEYFIDISNIEFCKFPDSNDLKSCFDKVYYSTEIEKILKLKKLITVFGKESEGDPNRFSAWFNLIKELNDYFKKQEKANKIFIYPLTDDDIGNFKNDLILLSKSNELRQLNNFDTLFSGNDENQKVKVKFNGSTLKNNDKYFIEEVNNKIRGLNKTLNNNNEQIKTNQEREKNLSSELKSIFEEKNKGKKKVKDLSYDLENLKEKFKIIKEKLFIIGDEKGRDDDKKKLLEEQKIIEKNIHSLETEISATLKNLSKRELEISEFSSEINQCSVNIKNINKENERLKEEIKKFETLLNSFKKNKYHAFMSKIDIVSESNIDTSAFEHEIVYDLDDLEKSKHNYITENIAGLLSKMKRYRNALDNAAKGYYRNPYLLYSIINNPYVENEYEPDEEIIKRYKLNEKQQSVLRKGLAVSDTFYLQGPPGTGKTQTICAISEELVRNNNNVLMTSSTHEAISNYMDKLYKETSNNPNFIIFKYSYTPKKSNKNKEEDKNLKYSEQALYPLFINKIRNFAAKTSGDDKTILKLISSLNNDTRKKLDKTPYLNKLILSNLENKIKKNQELNSSENKIWEAMCDYCGDVRENIEFFEPTSKILMINNNKNFDDNEKSILDNIYETWYQQNGIDFKTVTEIEKSQKSDDNLLSEKINKYFSNKGLSPHNDAINSLETLLTLVDDSKSSEFSKYISDNNLINIIGITTTARTSFKINGEERDLFVDYPIDTVIIDEISKSSTPEILARAILARRVFFCGDYNQLPATTEIDQVVIEEIFNDPKQDKIQSKLVDKIFNIKTEGLDGEKIIEEVYKEIEELYQQSFFYNQVKKIKKSNQRSRNYEFLTHQYRFSEEIMNVVNINYRGEELKLGRDPSYFENRKFDLKINGTSYKQNDVILVETSKFNKSYKKKLKTYLGDKASLNEAFDQKLPIFSNFSGRGSGVFNEYNGEVCLKICEELINSNKEDLTNKIGIICLTANQKQLIKSELKKNPELKRAGIWVDTIDNFQGREKEIIIVDFVRAKNAYNNKKSIKVNDEQRDLSFISCYKRNNVALSRAQFKLILVGSFDYYKNDNRKIGELSKEYIKKASVRIDWCDYEEE